MKSGDLNEGTMITIPEAAFALKRSWHSTYALILSGKIKATREGRHWRVDKASVDQFLRDSVG